MVHADAPSGGAPLRLVQSLAIGVELANGWHTWHEVLNTGDFFALLLCMFGFIAGGLATHAASLKSGAQATVGSSLFWLSCTLSGGLIAIAQLRIRLQTSHEDAFFVNALISSTLLGCCVPHAARELLFSPSVEVLVPSVLAVLVTEALCSQDAFPQFQVLAGLFLMVGGLRGLILADALQLNPANAEAKPGPSKATRVGDREKGSGKEKEPPADPFFPATVLESQKYSPHFLVSRRRRCLGTSQHDEALLQLVPRQAPEHPRGKAKAEAKRREKAPLREPVPFDPLPGEAAPKAASSGDPTSHRRNSEASQATQTSQASQGAGASVEDAREPLEELPLSVEEQSLQPDLKQAQEPPPAGPPRQDGDSWSMLLESAKRMVSSDSDPAQGAGTSAPQHDAGSTAEAPSLNAAAAVFVPSATGALAPPPYAESYAEPPPFAEPYVEAFSAEPYAEAPFPVYQPLDGPVMAAEVPYAGHGMDAMHPEVMYTGMETNGDGYDGFGGQMGHGHDPYAYQDYSHMQAWSWNEAQPYAGDALPSMGGGFQHYGAAPGAQELDGTEDGSDESGREPSRPTASPLDDRLPDPGAGRASEARRSAQDLRKEKSKGRGSVPSNSLMVGGLDPLDQDSVRELCKTFGTIENVKVITDRDGLQSALVDFAGPEEVEACLKGLGAQPQIWVRRPGAAEGRREARRGSERESREGGKGYERTRDGPGKGPGRGRNNNNKGTWEPRADVPRLAAEEIAGGLGSDCFWAYIDPKGGIQHGFNSAKMRGWYESGYFKEHLEVAMLRDSQEKPLRSAFRPLREWFPDLTKSFIVKPARR